MAAASLPNSTALPPAGALHLGCGVVQHLSVAHGRLNGKEHGKPAAVSRAVRVHDSVGRISVSAIVLDDTVCEGWRTGPVQGIKQGASATSAVVQAIVLDGDVGH